MNYGDQPLVTRREIKAYIKTLVDAGERNAHVLSERVSERFGVEWAARSLIEGLRWDGVAGLTIASPEDESEESDPDDVRSLTSDELEELTRRHIAQHSPLRFVPNHLRSTRLEEMGFDTPQDAVALFSDLHYHSRIDRRATAGLAEYNIDIARDRLARWRDGVLRFTQLSQVSINVDTLHLLALGDELEGHGAMFPTQGIQMSDSVYFQCMDFVLDMTEVILELLQRYKKIRVYKVHGNHGRGLARAREAYGPDNWELAAWGMIAAEVARHTGGTWTETMNGVRCLTGGQVEFFISPSFIMFLEIMGWNVAMRHGHGIKGLQSTYCLAPETRVLTQDLRWVPAGDLRVGDQIVGFDEEPQQRTRRPSYTNRHYKAATITAAERRVLPTYRVTLENGDEFIATGEHKWLVSNGASKQPYWIRTDEIEETRAAVGKRGPKPEIFFCRFMDTWEADDSRAAGLLAGAFDGEGSVTVTRDWGGLRFAQNDNAFAADVIEALDELGFEYDVSEGKTLRGKRHLTIGLPACDTTRFLGTVRPSRLIDEWRRKCRLEDRQMRFGRVRVVSVAPAGDREVAAISSSSATYLSEGYGSHNTGALDNKFRLNAIVGEVINYYFKAHLHEAQSSESEIQGEVIQNGCFVGPSLLSVEMSRAAANIPSQEFMLFHPRRGKTHHYRIHLAEAADIRQHEWVGREEGRNVPEYRLPR